MKPVVIVGGGITGLAAAWELQQNGLDYILLEGSARLGGKIYTERVEGFVIEAAADSFITQKPAGWQLCHELSLTDRPSPTHERPPTPDLRFARPASCTPCPLECG